MSLGPKFGFDCSMAPTPGSSSRDAAAADLISVVAPAPCVTLREITADTVRAVTDLTVTEPQRRFVASNAISLAQALFAAEAWYRAIHVGEDLAGFVMLYDESLRSPPPDNPQVGVWRLMVDARFQGQGVGRAAMRQVVEHVRAKHLFQSLEVSFVPGAGCPEQFYLGLGFRHTGRVDGGEVVLEMLLGPSSEDSHVGKA